MTETAYDETFWRDKAREASAAAGKMRDPSARKELLTIAQAYMRLADRARRNRERRSAAQMRLEGELLPET